MNIADYFQLLQDMRDERSRAVIQVMTDHIPGIYDYLSTDADRALLEKWIRDWLRPMAAQLGDPISGEPAERTALRSDLFETLASYGRDPQLVSRARSTVEQYMAAPDSSDAALARNSLRVAARNGDAALYDKYLEHLKTAKTPQEYDAYLYALGEFPQPELARRTFALVLSDQVKNQDMYAFQGPLYNDRTQRVAWELFKENFPAIVKKSDASDVVGLAQVAGVFCDAQLRDDSQKFFAAQNLPGSQRILENAKDFVNACIQLRELQQKNLSTYLNATH